MVAAGLSCGAVPAIAETLNEALAAAYNYNPKLDAQRAALRATDEEVAKAMSGFRPRIEANGETSWQNTNTRPDSLAEGKTYPKAYSVDAVQPIFTGLQTVYGVRGAEATVRAGREQLRAVEQEVLLDAVIAFADVVRDQAIVQERENNVVVLSKELKATQDRFAVGEVTKTDVAQAQARRAGAVSALDQARANLKSRRAAFEQVIGHPPAALREPSGFDRILPKSLDEAVAVAVNENPAVVGALYDEEAARHAVDRIRGELLPEVQVEASYQDRFDSDRLSDEREVATVTGRVRVPIYEGGEVHARVRQAKQQHIEKLQRIEQARSEVQAQVTSAWSQLLGVRAKIDSDRVQVEANQTALAGVREEERVGQRTLLDVLDAELELLNSQVQLSQTRRDLVVAAYSLVQSMGRLEVAQLGVADPVYDPEIHYHEVRRKWWGITVTDEEGRTVVVPPPAGYAPAK
jgi:outer membrane protein